MANVTHEERTVNNMMRREDVNKFVGTLFRSRDCISLVADLLVKLGAVMLKDTNAQTVTTTSSGKSPAYPNGIKVDLKVRILKDGERCLVLTRN